MEHSMKNLGYTARHHQIEIGYCYVVCAHRDKAGWCTRYKCWCYTQPKCEDKIWVQNY